MSVAVLFARPDSVYKRLPGVDVWDMARDARRWPGGCPGVFHPPCRAWGKLRQFAKPRDDEPQLALWAIDKVRQFGGVLEHPAASLLWKQAGCLSWGVRDQHGGVLVPVFQSWWGHRAPKQTGLYIVGPVPELPYSADLPGHRVELMGLAERERTPEAFASWLVSVAAGCAS